MANLLSNRLTGDAFRRSKTNVDRGPNAWMLPWAEVPLQSSGLLGPVRIDFAQIIKNE